FGGPCAYKNTLAGHFLPHIQKVLPSILFIYVTRDFLEIAHSIFKVRQKKYGDAKHWWSMKPHGYEALKDLDPYEQIAGQVRQLHVDLEKQKNAVPASNVLEASYEQICADPRGFLERVQQAAARLGIRFTLTDEPIEPFPRAPLAEKDLDVQRLRVV